MLDFTRLRRAVNSHSARIITLQQEIDVVARAIEAATVNCETVVALADALSRSCTQLITAEFGLTFSPDAKTLYLRAPVGVATTRAEKRARTRSPSPKRVAVSLSRNTASASAMSTTEVAKQPRTAEVIELGDDEACEDADNYGVGGDLIYDDGMVVADADDDDDANADEDYVVDHSPILEEMEEEEEVAEKECVVVPNKDEAAALVARKMALNDTKIDTVTEQLDNATDSQKSFLTAELERLQDEQKALQRSLASALALTESAEKSVSTTRPAPKHDTVTPRALVDAKRSAKATEDEKKKSHEHRKSLRKLAREKVLREKLRLPVEKNK